MRYDRAKLALFALLALLAWLVLRSPVPPAPSPSTPAVPAPAPVLKPEPPCPSWPQESGRRSSASIQEGGKIGPGGRQVMVDFPPDFWRPNVVSRGEGCCGYRSIDYAAHWQNVPVLWDFPEWLQQRGLPGGAYPTGVTERMTAICRDRRQPEPGYIQSEARDLPLLKLVLATGRLPITDYAGMDGVHYGQRIAHCICPCYVDDNYVCILDNNFPPDRLLWMPTPAFQSRWSGWIIALLAPRPPMPPRN